VGVTTVLAFIAGTLVGMLSAWRRGGLLDSVFPPLFVIVSAFPYFFLALMGLLLFNVTLHWVPLGFGYSNTDTPGLDWHYIGDVLYHAILPATVILVTSVGGWVLTMRNNMISTLSEDYVRMARAKGLSPARIMFAYAGRNAVLPNLTGFAMSLGFVVSGPSSWSTFSPIQAWATYSCRRWKTRITHLCRPFSCSSRWRS